MKTLNQLLALLTLLLLPRIRGISFEDSLPPANASYSLLLRSIVHPLWPYFACQYYVGNEEHHARTVSAVFEHGVDAVHLDSPSNLSAVREFDSIYVPVLFFPVFVERFLPALPVRVLLVTGQYMKPMLNVTPHTDAVLRHPKIAHWFMQNAVYVHPKVTQIPYGIHHERLQQYVSKLHSVATSRLKHGGVKLLPMNYNTHVGRQQLKDYLGNGRHKKLSEDEYLNELASAYFVVSPAGDRPETYRHWEAIGLLAIPVCNCPLLFQRMFHGDMFFAEIPQMIAMLNASESLVRDLYHAPDRSILLIAHWVHLMNQTKHRLSIGDK